MKYINISNTAIKNNDNNTLLAIKNIERKINNNNKKTRKFCSSPYTSYNDETMQCY